MAPKTIENSVETIENHTETKHLNSTRTARPPRAWQFESNSNATEKMDTILSKCPPDADGNVEYDKFVDALFADKPAAPPPAAPAVSAVSKWKKLSVPRRCLGPLTAAHICHMAMGENLV